MALFSTARFDRIEHSTINTYPKSKDFLQWRQNSEAETKVFALNLRGKTTSSFTPCLAQPKSPFTLAVTSCPCKRAPGSFLVTEAHTTELGYPQKHFGSLLCPSTPGALSLTANCSQHYRRKLFKLSASHSFHNGPLVEGRTGSNPGSA